MLNLSKEQLFVLRRAYRSRDRQVVRADLMEAFGIAQTTATNVLRSVVTELPHLLKRQGYKIQPAQADPPAAANEIDLMGHLDRDAMTFADTGLRQDELPVNVFSFTKKLPRDPKSLWTVLRACVNQSSVLITYTDTERSNKGTELRFVPLCLEKIGDQWSVSGQDINHPENGVRTLVLARISGARMDPQTIPKSFIRGSSTDSLKVLHIKLDERLTAEQKSVMAHELGLLDESRIQIPQRCVPGYETRYAGATPDSSTIWTPLSSVSKS